MTLLLHKWSNNSIKTNFNEKFYKHYLPVLVTGNWFPAHTFNQHEKKKRDNIMVKLLEKQQPG